MLIGLYALAQSGKDTVCKMLEPYAFTVKRVAFADLLKDSVCALFGITREQVEEWKVDPTVRVMITKTARIDGPTDVLASMTFREFLQRYGTESHRDIFGEDFWLERALPLHRIYGGKEVLYLVTDVRFDNEMRFIRELGGVIVRIDRWAENPMAHHASEQVGESKHVTHVISNKGTLDDLRTEVDRVAKELGLTKVE